MERADLAHGLEKSASSSEALRGDQKAARAGRADTKVSQPAEHMRAKVRPNPASPLARW